MPTSFLLLMLLGSFCALQMYTFSLTHKSQSLSPGFMTLHFLRIDHSMSGLGPRFLAQMYWARAVSFFSSFSSKGVLMLIESGFEGF